MKIFELEPGNKFKLKEDGDTYTLLEFKDKRMPRIGKTLNAITDTQEGKRQHFISNFEIIKVD